MSESAGRYVKTSAIQQAAQGHELEILRAIGIDWTAGRGHIDCPYSDHGGKADWRWDDRRGRAFCTCIGNRPGEKKSHSILDVMMVAGGLDFEAAKIRVAELLNRDELIRTNGAGDRGNGGMTATALLGAPAKRRDDTLPILYLAHRLGVNREEVPIPITPIVGLISLSYYDPPPHGSKAKPKLVGEHPCAVFGTVAADGRTHAIRIYVAARGAGKADLGTDAEGYVRDPKKSATAAASDNTAGRAVLWGDPTTAPHIVGFEGIENAAAGALALKAEIEAGEIAVAAAITAGGVEQFQPYPATTRITIGADRDEAPKPGKTGDRPGSRRGETAAHKFGVKHHDRIDVKIALPGDPGETVDWLDILLRNGVEAVRAGILRAESYVPTLTELDEHERNGERASEMALIAGTYPLPAMDLVTLTYWHTAAGKIKVHRVIEHRNSEPGDKEPLLIPVATPFGVAARLRHVDQADAFGLRVVVQDMNGQPRAIDVDRSALGHMAAAEIRSMLFAAGLRTEGDGEMLAVQCLKAADPEREIIVVKRPGWQEVEGLPDPVFITPKGETIGAPDGFDLELAQSARMPADVAERGSLEGWRAATEAALAADGCEHWTLGVLAAFAGPISALCGLDTCGINLSGMSSSGKSLAQRLTASAWSTTDIRKPGLFQSARATDNSVEALAQRATGTVLALDELAHIDGKTAGKMIYTIAGGIGKRRMNADAGLRDSCTWATFAILSGECSLEEKIRGDGGEWVAGMAVRILDIDVTGVNRAVDPTTLRRINDIERHYGHAGPAFVRALVGHGGHRQALALRDRVTDVAKKLAGGDASDGATVRAATPLALLVIAGELAKRFALIPATTRVTEAVQWAWDHFKTSSDATVLAPETQAIASLRGWIAERWGVTIKNVDSEGGVNNRETIAWYDDAAIYIPRNRVREAAGGALKESHIGAVLDRRGLLAAKPREDRFCIEWVPKVGKVTAYALRRQEFGRSGHIADPDIFTVHRGGRDD